MSRSSYIHIINEPPPDEKRDGISQLPTGAAPPAVVHHESVSDLDQYLQQTNLILTTGTLGPSTAYSPPEPVSGTEVITLMIKRSFIWVSAGIAIMTLGTGIVQGVILPRIYTCPIAAECPGSFDPNSTNVIPLLQTLMQYWLKAGMVVATIGLLKLSAYQAWFILMRYGNTIDNLDYNLGAIRGSLLDAGQLLLQKGNRWLSLFVLGQLGISSAISLIVGLSISRNEGEKQLVFTHPGITYFPTSTIATLNSHGHLLAIAKVNSWALSNDTSHSSAYRGTLVIPDGRNISLAINARAAGPRINGSFTCVGHDNYTIEGNGKSYKIMLGGKEYNALPTMKLAVSVTSVGTAWTNYIWVSNTTGLLPNATRTSDGIMDIAFCTHKIYLADTQPEGGVQYIKANDPVTSGCTDPDKNVCVSDSVNNAILSWWGGWGTALWGMSCRGSVIGPLPHSALLNEYNCALTQELWSETVTSMLDAIIQTAPRDGDTSQDLVVPVEQMAIGRWWLQAIIPGLTLLLYVVGLYYTYKLSAGINILKELTLAEVIEAAQTEYVRSLIDLGKLRKTVVRYGSDIGFIRGASNDAEAN